MTPDTPAHLAPDAPILHWLSLRDNPCVADMTDEQLQLTVQKLKAYVQQPTTLAAKLQSDSDSAKPRRSSGVAAKKRAILDSL